ncbi:MAG: 4Fe-4S dicluster domain-containing protein [Candidatus Eiseniibacteriota bacterium]|nr:MAG: 4Fe-4S dicluster domain-containing protein [Candidatus Eisenbacteria bacterium]
MVNVTLDGKKIQVEEGTTILQAADKLDVKIPTLCYHPLLDPYAACRVCVVEASVKGKTDLVTSCNTKVLEGMEVKTASERALKARKLNVEMLMAQAPAAEPVKEIAKELGITKTRFEIKDPNEKCILCGLCVRTCTDVVGAEAISFIERGKDRTVAPPFNEPSEACIGCTACAYFCPTQAIVFEDKYGREIIHDELHLGPVTAIRVPIRQAVPMVPFIDKDACIHFKTEQCKLCEKVCEPEAINHAMEDEVMEIDVGSIIIATGYDIFDAKKNAVYGYGRLDNVLSGLDFERLCNAGGPTGGNILLKDGRKPESVAILHCVGSRDRNYNEWCSRVCCMYAMKFAHLVREKTGAKVHEFYIDIRAFGKGYEEFYNRLMEEDVIFIRGKGAEVTDVAETPEEEGKLVVVCEDTLLGLVRRVPVDMVLLGNGLEPRRDADEIARKFNIGCSHEGFFLERHPKLGPVHTASDGIFLAGACQGPKDIPDTVAQAGAAASEAMAMADRGTFELEPITSFINEELCGACKTCVALCPYTAITFDEEKNVSVVEEALCKGCGTCVAACPAGAATQHGFDDEEMFAEIEGALSVV